MAAHIVNRSKYPISQLIRTSDTESEEYPRHGYGETGDSAQKITVEARVLDRGKKKMLLAFRKSFWLVVLKATN